MPSSRPLEFAASDRSSYELTKDEGRRRRGAALSSSWSLSFASGEVPSRSRMEAARPGGEESQREACRTFILRRSWHTSCDRAVLAASALASPATICSRRPSSWPSNYAHPAIRAATVYLHTSSSPSCCYLHFGVGPVAGVRSAGAAGAAALPVPHGLFLPPWWPGPTAQSFLQFFYQTIPDYHLLLSFECCADPAQ